MPLDIKPVARRAANTKSASYVCKQCGAKSNPTFFAVESPPVAINCWRCYEGRHMAAEDQVKLGRGMILQPEAEAVKRVTEIVQFQQQRQHQEKERKPR